MKYGRSILVTDTTFWGERVDNLLARIFDEETATFNTEELLNLIRLLCDHMVERFPQGKVQDLGSI